MSITTTEKGKVTGMVANPTKQQPTGENLETERGKKDVQTLSQVLEIISRNAKLVQERTQMQTAIDELKEISFSSNSKISLSIEDDTKGYKERKEFKTYNSNAIKLSVENLIQAFEARRKEIESQIKLN